MKRILTLLVAAVAILSFTSCTKTALFNGRNLNGWEFYLDPDEFGDPVPFESVFRTTKDKEVVVMGKPFGYMRTDKPYSNYHLQPRRPVHQG